MNVGGSGLKMRPVSGGVGLRVGSCFSVENLSLYVFPLAGAFCCFPLFSQSECVRIPVMFSSQYFFPPPFWRAAGNQSAERLSFGLELYILSQTQS